MFIDIAKKYIKMSPKKYSYEKFRVLSFSINHSVCFYYIDFRLFYVKNFISIFSILQKFIIRQSTYDQFISKFSELIALVSDLFFPIFIHQHYYYLYAESVSCAGFEKILFFLLSSHLRLTSAIELSKKHLKLTFVRLGY